MRVPDTEELDASYRQAAEAHAARQGYRRVPALFRAFGAVGGLGPAMLEVSGVHRRMFPFGDRAREAVILVTAAAAECEYELAIHRQESRRAGLSAAQVAALTGPDPLATPALSATEHACVRLACDAATGRHLNAGAVAALGERGAIAVAAVVGHYRGLASFVAALDLVPETDLLE